MIPQWSGETVVCLAGGPSLTREDVESVRGKARVIAINNAFQIAPWADLLYACDGQWWRWYPDAVNFAGLKFSITSHKRLCPSVQHLKDTGTHGFDPVPGHVRTGRNSGYQAVHLAMQTGVSRIVLLGYDMQRGPKGQTHWHPEHPMKRQSPYNSFRVAFDTLKPALKERGIGVVNCSRRTALTSFDLMPLEDALSVAVAA